MKRLLLLFAAVMLLFTVSAKAFPSDKDVGKIFKTEVCKNIFVINSAVVSLPPVTFNFCQRTDARLVSNITQQNSIVVINELGYPVYQNFYIYNKIQYSPFPANLTKNKILYSTGERLFIRKNLARRFI